MICCVKCVCGTYQMCNDESLIQVCLHCLLNRMSATVFVQPLDLVKNRMQLSGKAKENRTVTLPVK